MSAANTDKLRKGFYGPATALSGSIGNTDATVPLNSTAGFPTDTAIDLTVDRVDASGNKTPSKQETITVVISGNNGINALRGVEGTAQPHSAGAVVEITFTAATHNNQIDHNLTEHNQDGTHKSSAYDVYNPVGIIAPFAGSAAPGGWLMCDGSAVSRTTYANLFGVIGSTFGAGDGSTTFNVPDMRSRTPVGVGPGQFATSFAASAVNTGTSQITVASNKSLFTGAAVVITNSGGSVPTGLTAGTTYYAININATTIQLASSLANAVAGTAISLTGQGSGTNTLTISYTNNALGALGGEEVHTLVANEFPSHSHSVGGGQNQFVHGGSGSDGSASLSQTGSSYKVTSPSVGTDSTGGSASHNVRSPFLSLNYIVKF